MSKLLFLGKASKETKADVLCGKVTLDGQQNSQGIPLKDAEPNPFAPHFRYDPITTAEVSCTPE